MRASKTQPERLVQNKLINYLKVRGHFVFTVRNGATYDPTRKIYRSNTSTKGVSDIIGITASGQFLAIEVKTKTGRPTKEQLQFLSEIEARGGLAFIARSLDDLKDRGL
jgi:hypothetical protein